MGTKVVVFNDASLKLANCFLSMWDSSSIHLEGESFHSIGHYLYWKKATVLGDTDMADRLLKCTTEQEIKFFGYDIKTQKSDKWDAIRYASLKRVLAEVAQDRVVLPRLQEYPVDTLFVYSDKLDRVYGTGLDLKAKENESPDTWNGQNLLGRAWSEVRRDV